jgi:beta-N-acetylhexosaminidase
MKRSLLAAILTISSLLSALTPAAAAHPPVDAAEELMADMTPEERVGQLFLIAFSGSEPQEPLLDMIRRGHVSGVILRAGNDNFVAGPETPAAAAALIEQLQLARFGSSSAAATSVPGEEVGGAVYVPLFVAVSLNRESSPYPEILEGLSEPATPMALGAAWDPSLAQSVGAQTGRELAALGFNLILGPSLDVLEEASQRSPGDLGVEGFGGDPYWVSELGRAYVEGLHAGGGGRRG